MLLAVFSDSHDHIANLRAAVEAVTRAGADMLLHCGDLISPFMLDELERFAGPVHLVAGNNVGDQHLISSRCARPGATVTFHGQLATLIVDGLRIACTHHPRLARGLAASGGYDLVCCGHSHRHGVEQYGDCLLVNPGELLGKDEEPGCDLIQLPERKVRHLVLGRRLLDPA
ncbi:MAG: YfcE family phosphodiesterase [Desulfobulbaceae bacterium A2]|nr:MAG: YfcE family phosphodiesterase [Desulfobulbaceae bacterium A2]